MYDVSAQGIDGRMINVHYYISFPPPWTTGLWQDGPKRDMCGYNLQAGHLQEALS